MSLQRGPDHNRAKQEAISPLHSRHQYPAPTVASPPVAGYQGLMNAGIGLLVCGLLIAMGWVARELKPAAPIADVSSAPQSLPSKSAPVTAPPAPTSWAVGSFPVEQFVAYTSPFGYRQHPYGGKRFHYGLDIAAPMGSYVRAWWEGEAVEISDDTACGTSVVVESGDWLHIYCHLQGHSVVEVDGDHWLIDTPGGIRIKQGESIRTGQRIGRVGMTGRTTGPHLHWGLKYQGNWIDPARVLQAMAQKSSP